MKLREITFKKTVRIIQVFRNINIYGKEEKSFELRKDAMEWKPISSKSGYVANGELFLPEQITAHPQFLNCDIITFNDHHPSSDISNLPELNHCFSTARKNQLAIFELRMKEELELHLHYGYFEIGIPERANFKLCTLQPNYPVEIKINGKTDASLTSRRARVFKEQYYIVEYLGDYTHCKLLKEPYDSYIKQIPETRKVIDLIKPLW